MLTRKQYELLVYIHERLKEAGVPPSFDEMKDALDLRSKSGIHRLIKALEERGDSMIEAGIFEGDTVLIRKTDSADTGDIVVALVDEEEATLKRLRRKGASIALEAANPAYETRIFGPDRVRIQGRLVGLI